MGKVGEGWETENRGAGADTGAKKHTHIPPPSPLAREGEDYKKTCYQFTEELVHEVTAYARKSFLLFFFFFLWEKCVHSTGQLV